MKSLSYITHSKSLLLAELGCLALFIVACGSNPPARTVTPVVSKASSESEKLPGEKGLGAINFRYFNKSTEAQLDIDLGNTDVYIEMSGKPKSTPADSNNIKSAQELFYQKRYPEALAMVKQALEANATAEGNALAGSIHYMMGHNSLARRYWQVALQMNPDLPEVANMLDRISNEQKTGSTKGVARPKASAKTSSAVETKSTTPIVDKDAPKMMGEAKVAPVIEEENSESSAEKPSLDTLKTDKAIPTQKENPKNTNENKAP